MLSWSAGWVRRVIRDFDRLGRGAFFPKHSGGRPPKFEKTTRRQLADLALSRPKDHGYPARPWDLDRTGTPR